MKARSYASPIIEKIMLEITPQQLLKVELQMKIAAMLDDYMKLHRLNKEQFAKQLGICSGQLSIWLSGRANFQLKSIALIQTKTNITIITL